MQVAAGVYNPVYFTGISFRGRLIQILGEPGAVLDCMNATAGFVANSSEPSAAVRAYVLLCPCNGAVAEAGGVCSVRLRFYGSIRGSADYYQWCRVAGAELHIRAQLRVLGRDTHWSRRRRCVLIRVGVKQLS